MQRRTLRRGVGGAAGAHKRRKLLAQLPCRIFSAHCVAQHLPDGIICAAAPLAPLNVLPPAAGAQSRLLGGYSAAVEAESTTKTPTHIRKETQSTGPLVLPLWLLADALQR